MLETLISLVNEQIDLILQERLGLLTEALGDPPTATPDPVEPSGGGEAPLSPPEAGGLDAGASGGTGAGGGGGGGAPPMDAGMDDAPMGGGEGGAPGGMGDFSSNFGGGGGGGGGGDMENPDGGEEGGEMPPDEPSAPSNPFKDAESVQDRLQVILDTAEKIANETADPQKVLRHVKALIQMGFSEPEKAAKAISDLFNTENPILQQVSKRLALFTFGV